jgi:hypothetical protein
LRAKTTLGLQLLLLLIVSGCATRPPEGLLQIDCAGPIARDASRSDLVATFGAGNVTDEDLEVGEGELEPGTVIYPDHPTRRIEVLWHDSARQQRPRWIRVGEPSDWVIRGMRTGMGLRHVETLNGREFSLYGFEWDYAGTVASWNGGRLESSSENCRVLARFSPPGDGAALEHYEGENSLSGETVHSSREPLMRKLNPTIYELLIIFE